MTDPTSTSTTAQVAGTVKWFSNKKGYGFISPDEGSIIAEDIFVHQSAIYSDGYRTLDEGWKVHFGIGHDDDGKMKAENVTSPDGGPCTGPRKPRPRRQRRTTPSDELDADGDVNVDPDLHSHGQSHPHSPPASQPPRRREPQPMWHDGLSEQVKHSLQEKGIRTTTGTIDVAHGALSRIKLGTRGYASMARSDGILAEGSFDFTPDGIVSFDWKRAIAFSDCWTEHLDMSILVAEVDLNDESIQAVGIEETMATLMGEGPTDPKSTLEASGFEMRRVVLTTKRR